MSIQPKTSLLKEVSISELLTMRASGMSNKEIAQSLDTTRQTILKYIGKQPTKKVRTKRTLPVKADSYTRVFEILESRDKTCRVEIDYTRQSVQFYSKSEIPAEFIEAVSNRITAERSKL